MSEHGNMVNTHLDIREVGLECVGAGIAGIKEHELSFLQMTGRQTLLGVHMMPVKEIQALLHTVT